MTRVLSLAASLLALVACRRTDPEPEARTIHLERWDGAGLPVVGDIDVTVRGFDPDGDLSTATGSAEVVCDPCVIEEGRLRPRAPNARVAAFAGDGIGFPRVDLGMVRGELKVAGGRATIEGHAAGGPALAIELDGTITFAARMADSPADLRLVLRPTAEIATVAPALSNMLLVLGPADATGAVSIHVTGPLGRLRRAQP